ncbi:hypothetical protein AB0758_49250 [Tolypothrix bouteillei VB521301_2]|uniref:hypothetical protein n=1 Tax=Tolypothrix bouteillei TaxID=1246981 RepID=UPI000907D950
MRVFCIFLRKVLPISANFWARSDPSPRSLNKCIFSPTQLALVEREHSMTISISSIQLPTQQLAIESQ